MNTSNFIIRIFIFIFFALALQASETEDIAKIKSIQDVVSQGTRYRLFTAELFDGDSRWSISRGSSFLDKVSFVSKTPASAVYKLDTKLYYADDPSPKLKSMQIHSNIEIPGRDKFFIKPDLVKPLPAGSPSRLFFWVFSNNYDINLKVILSEKKSPDVIVDFGLLKFNGWRRLDAKVNKYKPQDRLNLEKIGKFALKGILLESSSFQSKGSFFLFIDQMGILIEKPETYPGSEVPDGWELY